MGSILIYFIAFLISLIFIRIYERICDKADINEIESFNQKIYCRMLFLLSILPTVFIAAIRYDVGTDYFSYEMIYRYYDNGVFFLFKDLAVEYGYYLINYFSAVLFNDFYGVLLISASLTIGISFSAILKHRKHINVTFAMLIFYLLMYPPLLNGIRQLISVSIIMYGYSYIIERKLLKFALTVAVASLFHYTAVLCLPFYFLATRFKSRITILRRIAYYFLLISIIILMPILLDAVSELSIFSKYFSAYELGSDAKLLNQIILRLPILIPILVFSTALLKKNKELEFYYLIYFMEFVFIILGSYYVWAVRLTYYVMPSQIVLVPAIVKSVKNKYTKILLSMYFIIWYIIYFIYIFFIKGNDGIFPYHFR